MGIEYRKNLALFRGVVSVEEAEPLLAWLQKRPAGKLDLSACEHLHPANLQVLLAARASVQAWPKDQALSRWLEKVLRK